MTLAPEHNAFVHSRCAYCGQPKTPDYAPTHPECAAPLAAIREQDKAGLEYHLRLPTHSGMPIADTGRGLERQGAKNMIDGASDTAAPAGEPSMAK